MKSSVYIPVLMFFMFSCTENTEKLDSMIYNGPTFEFDNVTTLLSDSAVVKVKLEAPRQLEFDNSDKEFPQGLRLDNYDPDGSIVMTLTADYCYYYHESDTWRVLRNVVIKNLKTGEQLNTEELFWEPKKQMVHTTKFVRIETEGEILMGEGLEAKDDFSWWKILKARGTIDLNEDTE
jgi:LPS export ABC transporter protein LptC